MSGEKLKKCKACGVMRALDVFGIDGAGRLTMVCQLCQRNPHVRYKPLDDPRDKVYELPRADAK